MPRTSISFNKLILINCLWICTGCSLFIKNETAKALQPNILLIYVDQMNSDVLSAYGHRYLNTPNLDSLAKRGANFRRAYCAQPICGPSRVSMMTGVMPSQHGSVLNIAPTDKLRSQDWIGNLVRNEGYDCTYYGKWHIDIPPEEIDVHGFKEMKHLGGNKIDNDVVRSAKSFLSKEYDKPFFLVTSFNNPHNICEWARGDALPDGRIDTPPTDSGLPPLPGNFSPMVGEPSFIREFQQENPRVFPTTGWNPRNWQEYLWAYYQLIEKVDSKIGEVLKALDKSKYANNTVIIFTSDHGDGAAAHGWNQKSVLFENNISVPFIVCPPKQDNYQRTDHNQFISTGLDLLPTIVDYASPKNIQAIDNYAGRSVLPLIKNHDNTTSEWRRRVGVEMTLGVKNQYFGVRGRALLFENYKYILYKEESGDYHELLFDLAQDPGEMVNLASNPEFSEVLNQGRDLLEDWCKEHKDDFRKIIGEVIDL